MKSPPGTREGMPTVEVTLLEELTDERSDELIQLLAQLVLNELQRSRESGRKND